MRRERVIFETVFGKLEKELGVKRTSITRLVETVGQVLDRRDQAVEQLRLIQQASEHSLNTPAAKFNMDLDGIQVEDMPAEAPTIHQKAMPASEMAGTDLQKMQRAMGKGP